MQFYELSARLNAIMSQSKNLLGLHLLRYKHLADNSERGEQCTYARLARHYFFDEREAEMQTLKAMRDSLDSLISDLEELEACD